MSEKLKLWKKNYPAGVMGGVKTHDLFVWAGVHIETGEVCMEVREFDDELQVLCDGWEWQRFRLIPDNK